MMPRYRLHRLAAFVRDLDRGGSPTEREVDRPSAASARHRWAPVIAEASLPIGAAVRASVGQLRLIVGRTPKTLFAARDVCPHLDLPFTAFGPVELRDERLVCPWHFWEFDVATGRCEYAALYRDDEMFFFQIAGKEQPDGASAGCLARFPVRVRRGIVEVFVPDE